MRTSGSQSWRFGHDVDQVLHVALYFRDALRLETDGGPGIRLRWLGTSQTAPRFSAPSPPKLPPGSGPHGGTRSSNYRHLSGYQQCRNRLSQMRGAARSPNGISTYSTRRSGNRWSTSRRCDMGPRNCGLKPANGLIPPVGHTSRRPVGMSSPGNRAVTALPSSDPARRQPGGDRRIRPGLARRGLMVATRGTGRCPLLGLGRTRPFHHPDHPRSDLRLPPRQMRIDGWGRASLTVTIRRATADRRDVVICVLSARNAVVRPQWDDSCRVRSVSPGVHRR